MPRCAIVYFRWCIRKIRVWYQLTLSPKLSPVFFFTRFSSSGPLVTFLQAHCSPCCSLPFGIHERSSPNPCRNILARPIRHWPIAAHLSALDFDSSLSVQRSARTIFYYRSCLLYLTERLNTLFIPTDSHLWPFAFNDDA